MVVNEPGSESSPDNKSAGVLILDFPGSMAVENKLMFLLDIQSIIGA